MIFFANCFAMEKWAEFFKKILQPLCNGNTVANMFFTFYNCASTEKVVANSDFYKFVSALQRERGYKICNCTCGCKVVSEFATARRVTER